MKEAAEKRLKAEGHPTELELKDESRSGAKVQRNQIEVWLGPAS